MPQVLGTSTLISRHPHTELDSIVWPVSLADLKSHAQIPHGVEDLKLQEFIRDATEYVEQRGQVSLIQQQIRLALDYWPSGCTVAVPRGPLVSVQNVNYLNSAGVATVQASGWRADTRSNPGGIYFSDDVELTTADGEGVVWVNLTCGYGTTAGAVPAQWRQLILVIATHCYQRREMAAGGGFDESFERVIARKFTAAGRQYRYV